MVWGQKRRSGNRGDKANFHLAQIYLSREHFAPVEQMSTVVGAPGMRGGALTRILEFAGVKFDVFWSAAPDSTRHGGHEIREHQLKRTVDIIPAKYQNLKTFLGAEKGRALEAKPDSTDVARWM